MHTPETVEYLQRLVDRDYLLPLMNKTCADLEETLGRGSRGRGRGLFSISLKFTHARLLFRLARFTDRRDET
jgi:hypothetical protein